MAPTDKKSGGSPPAAAPKKPVSSKATVGVSAPAPKKKPAGPPSGSAVAGAAASSPTHDATGTNPGRKSPSGGSRRSSGARRPSMRRHSGSPQAAAGDGASSPNKPKLLVCLFGPPCSGKGTLAALMKEQLRMAHFSTGELLREVATQEGENSEIGAALKAGKLVEDHVIVRVLKEAMEKKATDGVGAILDGFPRNESQVDVLRQMNLWPGGHPEQSADVAFFIRVPSDTLFERMANRRVDPVTGEVFGLGFEPADEEQRRRLVRREDDKDDVLQSRIKDFEENMAKISVKMQGPGGHHQESDKREDGATATAGVSELIEIDGDRPIEEVFQDVAKHLKAQFPGLFQN
ncbi:adenylate kinase superfamily protein [Cystoisospora suis]|uniref:Adenylate kinase superfamily protein n=1 Tax=Cystoisospora suis TaxID=483139 RepID=A0A2C6KEA3_9APIC|nr:adenylate kinase superfamily protein [Cystoisospora suis]